MHAALAETPGEVKMEVCPSAPLRDVSLVGAEDTRVGLQCSPAKTNTQGDGAPSPGLVVRDGCCTPGPRHNHSHGSSSSQGSHSSSPAPHIKALESTPRQLSAAAAAVPLESLAQAPARPGGLLDAMRQRGTLPGCRPVEPVAPLPSSNHSNPSPAERKRSREASPEALRPRSLPNTLRPTAAKTKAVPKAAKVPEKLEASPNPAVQKPKAKRPPVPSFKPEAEPWQVLRQMPLPPKKAEENYEISDKGSDSEAEDDTNTKPVPDWSLKYLEMLQAQSDIDADTIFGSRVPKCDLEDVFKDSDYMKFQVDRPPRRRGSSGEWRHDRLSREEICAYKRKTGQLKRWQAKA